MGVNVQRDVAASSRSMRPEFVPVSFPSTVSGVPNSSDRKTICSPASFMKGRSLSFEIFRLRYAMRFLTSGQPGRIREF